MAVMNSAFDRTGSRRRQNVHTTPAMAAADSSACAMIAAASGSPAIRTFMNAVGTCTIQCSTALNRKPDCTGMASLTYATQTSGPNASAVIRNRDAVVMMAAAIVRQRPCDRAGPTHHADDPIGALQLAPFRAALLERRLRCCWQALEERHPGIRAKSNPR